MCIVTSWYILDHLVVCGRSINYLLIPNMSNVVERLAVPVLPEPALITSNGDIIMR